MSAHHPAIARRMSSNSDEPYLYETFTRAFDGELTPVSSASEAAPSPSPSPCPSLGIISGTITYAGVTLELIAPRVFPRPGPQMTTRSTPAPTACAWPRPSRTCPRCPCRARRSSRARWPRTRRGRAPRTATARSTPLPRAAAEASATTSCSAASPPRPPRGCPAERNPSLPPARLDRHPGASGGRTTRARGGRGSGGVSVGLSVSLKACVFKPRCCICYFYRTGSRDRTFGFNVTGCRG